ncbi:predicted protein [Histoplasma capsulatum G186AR]|uniref:Uncharacterized protein n=1 Tax=Ajellomyces capsulatus (strain G186AR / H82 / ATCC MYA-2454 / RMSCC 2432) TaxID=447093 RepID=C0NA75_AJECG|nr:uncharacterized protein HCBG_00021 [Histoplasma capsulatum G186AR]EEH10566.1 predicted protein [Histoplasma capsulatum G186AR]
MPCMHADDKRRILHPQAEFALGSEDATKMKLLWHPRFLTPNTIPRYNTGNTRQATNRSRMNECDATKLVVGAGAGAGAGAARSSPHAGDEIILSASDAKHDLAAEDRDIGATLSLCSVRQRRVSLLRAL